MSPSQQVSGALRYSMRYPWVLQLRFDTVFRCCDTRPAKAGLCVCGRAAIPRCCVAAAAQVLRLLRHLESEKDFNKSLAQ